MCVVYATVCLMSVCLRERKDERELKRVQTFVCVPVDISMCVHAACERICVCACMHVVFGWVGGRISAFEMSCHQTHQKIHYFLLIFVQNERKRKPNLRIREHSRLTAISSLPWYFKVLYFSAVTLPGK